MKYYLSVSDQIYAFEDDGSQDAFIPAGLVLLSAEGLEEARARQAAANAPTLEQLTKSANDERDSRLRLAALRIAPLQDAVDLDQATPDDSATLKLWKQYRIAVNRVAAQAGFPVTIEWPSQPAQ